MRVRCFNIQWDFDDEDTDLPTETVVALDYDSEVDESEQIGNRLSDIYGFCHKGFEYEVEKETLTVNLGVTIPGTMKSEEMEDKLVKALAAAGIDATVEIVERE